MRRSRERAVALTDSNPDYVDLAVASLYENLFDLAVPVAWKVQIKHRQLLRDPKRGIFVPGSRLFTPSFVRQLVTLSNSSTPAVTTPTATILSHRRLRHLMRVNQHLSAVAIGSALTEMMDQKSLMKMIAWEYALHRREINSLKGIRQPTETIVDTVSLDMHKGKTQ